MNGANNATKSYNLIYDTNGGMNGPATTSVLGNDYYAIAHIDTITPTREGFTFSGWSFSPDGIAEVFSEDLLTLTSDTTLYAVWTKESENIAVTGEETEGNTEPLGVVTSSNNGLRMDTGAFVGCSLVCLAVFLVAFVVARSRRPRILSKTYEDSDTDDFDF